MPSGRKKRKGAISMSSSNSTTGRKRLHRRDDLGREESESDRGKVGTCRGNNKRCSATAKAATAPSSCNGSSPGASVRGLKRKSGCVDLVARDGLRKRLEDEFSLGRAIGRGKFGSVRLCRSKANGEEYACKTLLKNAGETVQREVEIMQHLSGHAGVVMLRAVFEDHECFHLVMEMCSGGRLLDQMAKEGVYTEHRAANVIKELVEIVKYCHEMGVAHRDIKPENILLTASGEMKLADFGLAMRFSKEVTLFFKREGRTSLRRPPVSTGGQQLSGFAGTPAYVAPEVLSGYYSEKVDIWSAGILLHALLVGVLPFRGDSRDAIIEAVKKTELCLNGGIWDPISNLARDLIKQMLSRDASTRMTADQVLNHPWILFYTARPHKVLPNKLRARESYVITSLHSEETVVKGSPHHVRPLTSYENSNVRENESEESGFANMLAAAINRIQISDPKRIRLCAPESPIPQECSSNLKSNLLAAF